MMFAANVFFFGFLVGGLIWFVLRFGVSGLFTVGQNERAVKTSFGRARRLGDRTTLDSPLAADLSEDERDRYVYPQVEVIPPGGPYWRWPWEKVHKVSVATEIVSLAHDPESPEANKGGSVLEAVTKDQLDTGLTGQIRYRISEQNLYAYLFGTKAPITHVLGYFVSVLRQKVASFEAKTEGADGEIVQGISINDLRKNLRELNDSMDRECRSSEARYGIVLDACLITGIDPPHEVESALAAINTAHNHVSSEVSLAQAAADQRIVQSKRAVEIATFGAQAEVEPLRALARELSMLRERGPEVLAAYVRNVRLSLYSKAKRAFLEERV